MGRLHNERPNSDLERSEFIVMSSNMSVTTTYRCLGLVFGHDPPYVAVRFTNSERDAEYIVFAFILQTTYM